MSSENKVKCSPVKLLSDQNIDAPTNGGKGYRTDRCWCIYLDASLKFFFLVITLVIERDTEEIGVVVCYLNVNIHTFIWSFKHCYITFVDVISRDRVHLIQVHATKL